MENITRIDQHDQVAFTIDELAQALRVSKPTAYDMIHINGFPALRVGKRWLIPCKAVERWLEENCGKEF